MRKTKEYKLVRGYPKLTNLKSYKIQVIRGIAIVGVVFIHNTGGGYTKLSVDPSLILL